eukprot:GHUV01045210.1.p1 GENE.GHUV01045210.1~~GHUV01045210.1.p1  ORF type:complete len:134 (-),score=17.08 GHUV01045210.1:35-436(-)
MQLAVRTLNLGIERGECFGLLGPNGAGKSTSINMMVGLLEPTAGTALIGGYDITKHMDAIYSLMGVCPQHDLLWETLTGREHLLFYGRLKGLKGVWMCSAAAKFPSDRSQAICPHSGEAARAERHVVFDRRLE